MRQNGIDPLKDVKLDQQRRDPGARRLLARRPEPVRHLHRARRLAARTRRQGALPGLHRRRPSGPPTTRPSWRPTNTSANIPNRDPGLDQRDLQRRMKWTAAAPTADVVDAVQRLLPRRQSEGARRRGRSLSQAQIWKNEPGDRAEKPMEKFQDILVQGNVLDAAKRVKFEGLVSHRIRQQGEVIRASSRAHGGAGPAESRVARRRPALFRPGGRDRGAQGISLQSRAGRVRRHHRPERLRQEHAAVAHLRHPEADRRRRAGRWQAGHRADPQGRLHAAAGLSCSSGARSWRTPCSAPKSRAPTC